MKKNWLTTTMLLLLAGAACSSGKGAVSTSATTAPGAQESSPAGDIPDDQAFVRYSPMSGTYAVKVPEGWARAATGDHVTFTDKLNTIELDVAATPGPPTVASVRAEEVPTIKTGVTSFELVDVTSVTRPAGGMILVRYRADSKPDAVTGKVVRDDVERYETWKDGRQATITLSGPQGSDNVDPWKIVTDSFTWA